MHQHDSEQMTYVLQGALRVHVDGEEVTVREGEVLHIPAGCRTRPKRSTTRSSWTCSARRGGEDWLTRTPARAQWPSSAVPVVRRPPEYTSNFRRIRFIFHLKYRYLISASGRVRQTFRYR